MSGRRMVLMSKLPESNNPVTHNPQLHAEGESKSPSPLDSASRQALGVSSSTKCRWCNCESTINPCESCRNKLLIEHKAISKLKGIRMNVFASIIVGIVIATFMWIAVMTVSILIVGGK